MNTIIIAVYDTNGELACSKEVKNQILNEAIRAMEVCLESKPMKHYQKLGYDVQIHHMPKVGIAGAAEAFQLQCFRSLCLRYKLTKTEMHYARMMMNGVKRTKMGAQLFKRIHVIVDKKTVDTHCLNVLKKLRVKDDRDVRSRFLP